MIFCKNQCSKYKGEWGRGSHVKNYSPYLHGIKYCRTCSEYIKWKGNRCPCCNNRLSKSPKTSTSKKYIDGLRDIPNHYHDIDSVSGTSIPPKGAAAVTTTKTKRKVKKIKY